VNAIANRKSDDAESEQSDAREFPAASGFKSLVIGGNLVIFGVRPPKNMERRRKYVLPQRVPQRPGFTCIEVFAGWFVLFVPFLTFQVVASRYGVIPGVEASLVSFVASFMAVVGFYSWAGRLHEKKIRELISKYPFVYRVTARPTDTNSIVKPDGNDIAVGDFGWEAEPIHDNGLTYLHGLTEDWQVAWYAGFQSDQIERVGPKPRLQYHLPYSWVCAGGKPPICPFPVRNRPLKTLGHPIRIIGRWVQGSNVPRQRNGRTNR
jgi:hypothetical protein